MLLAFEKVILKDHLEISASASWYQHWHQNWHQHQHYKILIFVLRSFVGKIEHLCPLHFNVLPLSLFLFLHPEASTDFLEKTLFKFSEEPFNKSFKK